MKKNLIILVIVRIPCMGSGVLLQRETTFVRVLFIFYLIASLICLFLIPFFGFINKIKRLVLCLSTLCICWKCAFHLIIIIIILFFDAAQSIKYLVLQVLSIMSCKS